MSKIISGKDAENLKKKVNLKLKKKVQQLINDINLELDIRCFPLEEHPGYFMKLLVHVFTKGNFPKFTTTFAESYGGPAPGLVLRWALRFAQC